MRVPAGLLIVAALSTQTLTLPDWMHSSQRDLPAEVFPAQTPSQTSPPALDVRYADEPFVVEQMRRRVRFENDGTGRREVEARIRIQTDAGVEAWGQLAFAYYAANERLDLEGVEVRKPSGEVIKATVDNIQDLAMPIAQEAPVYSDYRQRHVTVPALRPGDTLSYRAVVTAQTALVPGQFWFVHDFERQGIVLDEQLAIDLPAERAVIVKVRPGVEGVTGEAAAPGRVVHAWRSAHLTREKPESTTTKTEKTEQPAIQLTTFRNWEEVARWYADLTTEPARADAAIAAKAQELTRGKTTPLDKLDALSDYVAHNVRYVSLSFGLGRYEPHRAADVLANQYGDCKDKHTLLAALAAAAGLQVLPVLANSSRAIDPDVPSPGQFDHVISVMPAGTDRRAWIWTDTTVSITAFRQLLPALRGKQLLLAAKSTAPSALIETPKGLPTPPSDRISATGTLSDRGKLDLRVSVTRRGDVELLLRVALLRLPRARWSEFGDAMAKRSWIGGTISDFSASDPTATREPFQLGFRQVRENYVAFDSNGRYRMPLPLDRLVLSDTTEDDWKGTDPVELGESEAAMHVQLTVPESVTMQAPLDVSLSRDYADYQTTYRVDGQTLTVDRTIRWKVAELPTSRGADYLAFVRALRADEEQLVQLERKGGAASPSTTANATAQELHQAAMDAHKNGRFVEAVALYKRVIALDPQHKYDWNNMGLSQLALDQLDEAAASFRKQIEINPFDQWSYNNLGQALRRKHQFNEAAAAFRKQIDINPLDQFAWRNLGSMADDRGQYAEARTALEKAVAITPTDPGLRITLGGVYLRLKLDAEATAAFDKAVQMAPVPPIWNSIAYALAQNEVHLDRAQQYAESAVNGCTTVLRQTTLDNVTVAHMRVVTSLAAAWDTLGWVAFKRGDLVVAERYIRAAWLLAQHAEVGDHLGQLYEKQGKASEAIAAYEQALAARNPPEDTRGRLDRLLTSSPTASAETLIARGAKALAALRTLTIPRPTSESAGAGGSGLVAGQVLLLLDSAGKGADSKFLGANAAAMAPWADALRAAPIPVSWPDATATKLVRRGDLRCAAGSATCELVLERPEDVRTLEPEP